MIVARRGRRASEEARHLFSYVDQEIPNCQYETMPSEPSVEFAISDQLLQFANLIALRLVPALVAAMTSCGGSPSQSPLKAKARKGKDIEAKMLKTLSDDARSHDWTSVEWAKNLGCAEATIRGTKIWKVHLPKLHASHRVEGEGKMDDSVKRKRGRANPGQSHADD